MAPPCVQPPSLSGAALQAAEAEARVAWSLVDVEPIPFNHCWEHVQQVVKLAIWLAAETGADPDVVEAAAWLHDVRKTERNHGMRGAETASSILRETELSPTKVDAVVDAIRHKLEHSF